MILTFFHDKLCILKNGEMICYNSVLLYVTVRQVAKLQIADFRLIKSNRKLQGTSYNNPTWKQQDVSTKFIHRCIGSVLARPEFNVVHSTTASCSYILMQKKKYLGHLLRTCCKYLRIKNYVGHERQKKSICYWRNK